MPPSDSITERVLNPVIKHYVPRFDNIFTVSTISNNRFINNIINVFTYMFARAKFPDGLLRWRVLTTLTVTLNRITHFMYHHTAPTLSRNAEQGNSPMATDTTTPVAYF